MISDQWAVGGALAPTIGQWLRVPHKRTTSS
jgi:hypothetical protein